MKQNNGAHSDRPSGQARGNRVRGRYSGEALRPRQLLEQLSEPPSQLSGRKDDAVLFQRRERDTGVDNLSDTGAVDSHIRGRSQASRESQVPKAVAYFRKDFIQANKTPPDDRAIWTVVKRMVNARPQDRDLKTYQADERLGRALFFWAVRASTQWLQMLRTKGLTDDVAVHQDGLEELPSPSQALTVLCVVGSRSPSALPRILWLVTKEVTELYAATSRTDRAALHVALQELMRIWNYCMARELQRQDGATTTGAVLPLSRVLSPSPCDWSFLPPPDAFQESLQRRRSERASRTSFAEVVAMLMGTMEGRGKDIFDFPSAALVTLDILQLMKGDSQSENAVKEFEPWMVLMHAALRSVPTPQVPAAFAQTMDTVENDAVKEHYRGAVGRLGLARSRDDAVIDEQPDDETVTGVPLETQDIEPATVIDGLPSLPTTVRQPDAPARNPSATDRFVYLSIKRLGRAQEQQSLKAAEAVWTDATNFGYRNQSVQLPVQLYEHLMLTLLALRGPQPAVEAWNHMIKSGHQPSSKTYTVLMRGSLLARDINALETFWSRMRKAGTQPDSHAWSTRIFGLLRHKKRDAGLQAVAEMGREWVAAATAAWDRSSGKGKGAPPAQHSDLVARFTRDVDGVPKPDLVVMNSSISALAATDDNLIPKVIAWGRSFGVEPNLTTYNVLINISMRRGLVDEALSMLSRMNERGIEANSTTWTVLLTAMFKHGFLDDQSPQEQESRLLNLLASLESATGSGVDVKGYALTIDRLLKVYNNSTAAQAVVSHMVSRGVQPTAHIYTILMTSYFQQSPPNFAAAESLWSHIQSSNAGYGAILDSQFYDRMVEGYATHHASVGSAPMLAFLASMEAEEKQPSWRALESVARALAGAGEWQRLAQVVDGVRRRLRAAGIGSTTTGQADFWRFVISTGLLRHEGITTAEQIMRAHQSEHENMGAKARVMT